MSSLNSNIVLNKLESILASPTSIKNETNNLIEKFSNRYNNKKSYDEIEKLIAKKIISNYSYYCAYSGGVTSLSSVIPGVGTAITLTGGVSADYILCLKFQIEMIMSLAHLYKHDIETEETMRICYLLVGIGALTKAMEQGGNKIGNKAFIRLVRKHLTGATLKSTKKIFNIVGLKFTRKAFEKSAPLGIGCVLGFSINKSATLYLGNKADSFFRT